MALYKFTEKMIKGESIEVYNEVHKRDFTYIDDIIRVYYWLKSPPKSKNCQAQKITILKNPRYLGEYISGNSSPVFLKHTFKLLVCAWRKIKELLPLQPGDVLDTC